MKQIVDVNVKRAQIVDTTFRENSALTCIASKLSNFTLLHYLL